MFIKKSFLIRVKKIPILSRLATFLLPITLITLAMSFAQAENSDINRQLQPIIAGSNDSDTPVANSTVYVGGCTGTLITPDIVITAGHCAIAGPRITRTTGAGLPCSDHEAPARWYPVRRDGQVSVGVDRTRPRFTANVAEYAMPGCADIFALRLDRPVPAEIAIPTKVLTRLGSGSGSEPSTFFSGKTFLAAGWGNDETGRSPAVRQIAVLRYLRHNGQKLFARGAAGQTIGPGDSGGPIYWQHPSGIRYMVGVIQGTEKNGDTRFYPTYRNVILDPGYPSVGWFFEQIAPEAVDCDMPSDRPSGTVPLRNWWSKKDTDNFATTNDVWIGCVGAVRGNYGFNRIEGYVYNPGLPQPRNTVALYSWYDKDRKDNFITSNDAWRFWEGGGTDRSPMYKYVRLEGYIFDPNFPQPPGTVPLILWFDPNRKDNWTTTQFRGSSGATLSPNYHFSEILGYVFPPPHS